MGIGVYGPGQYGSPASITSLYADFAQHRRKAALHPFRIHDLRHAYVAHEFANGTPMPVISRNLGHTSVTITQDTYWYLAPRAGKEAAVVMDAILREARAERNSR